MPRSSYVYLVWDRERREPLAAFTVKHEMLAWVRGNLELPATYQVLRFPDVPVHPRRSRGPYQTLEV